MKILILIKGLTQEETNLLYQGMNKVKELLPQMDFIYQTTDFKFSSTAFKNDVASGYTLNNQEILPLVNSDYDIACLFFDWTEVTPQPTNPATSLIKKGNTIPMAIPKQWYNGYVDTLVQFFLHEVSHAEHFRYGVKDLTHDFYASAYAQGKPTDFFVFLLKRLWEKPAVSTPISTPAKSPYKYFSLKEIEKWKLSTKLWQKLDMAREYAQTPFSITSGLRNIDQNNAVGGSKNSTHLTGTGCDIACTDSAKRWKMIDGLLKAGFTRLGIYKSHIHCDLGASGLPDQVVWLSDED